MNNYDRQKWVGNKCQIWPVPRYVTWHERAVRRAAVNLCVVGHVRYAGIVSQSVVRNCTWHPHPAQVLAWTGRCSG